MVKKTLNTQFVEAYPNLKKLVELYGAPKTNSLLGLSDVNALIRGGKVRPAYEIAATHLLPSSSQKTKTFVVKGDAQIMDSLLIFVNATGIEYLELDL